MCKSIDHLTELHNAFVLIKKISITPIEVLLSDVFFINIDVFTTVYDNVLIAAITTYAIERKKKTKLNAAKTHRKNTTYKIHCTYTFNAIANKVVTKYCLLMILFSMLERYGNDDSLLSFPIRYYCVWALCARENQSTHSSIRCKNYYMCTRCEMCVWPCTV